MLIKYSINFFHQTSVYITNFTVDVAFFIQHFNICKLQLDLGHWKISPAIPLTKLSISYWKKV